MVEDNEHIRRRIFADVLEQSEGGSRTLSRDWLLEYTVDGERLPLIDAQGRGIRNPRNWDYTLSVTTSESGPYQDIAIQPGVWRYPYCIGRGGGIDPSNAKLFQAHAAGIPMLYFYKPMPRTYLPIGMVEAIDRNDSDRTFTIALSETSVGHPVGGSVLERQWAASIVERRLHQPRFRAIVMSAYGSRCAICGLPDPSLLDAAHIRGDKDPNGQPVVQNGLALCAIHHRAYDTRKIGIDEDLRLHVRPDVLDVADGPVLAHAIQALPGRTLAVIPKIKRDRPDRHRLELTFKEYLSGFSTSTDGPDSEILI